MTIDTHIQRREPISAGELLDLYEKHVRNLPHSLLAEDRISQSSADQYIAEARGFFNKTYFVSNLYDKELVRQMVYALHRKRRSAFRNMWRKMYKLVLASPNHLPLPTPQEVDASGKLTGVELYKQIPRSVVSAVYRIHRGGRAALIPTTRAMSQMTWSSIRINGMIDENGNFEFHSGGRYYLEYDPVNRPPGRANNKVQTRPLTRIEEEWLIQLVEWSNPDALNTINADAKYRDVPCQIGASIIHLREAIEVARKTMRGYPLFPIVAGSIVPVQGSMISHIVKSHKPVVDF